MKDTDSKDVRNTRMFQHWLTLGPRETQRSAKSVSTRWNEMVTMYRLFLFVFVGINHLDLSLSSIDILFLDLRGRQPGSN